MRTIPAAIPRRPFPAFGPGRGRAVLFGLAVGCMFLPWLGSRADPPAKTLHFANDIVPILTKAECNTGACHAKAITGQRGFRLSLLGFEPEEDYEHIVKEGRGRRIFPPAPEQSLLLQKAANLVPHSGGKKLDPDSEAFRTLVRWIGEGMPYGSKEDPQLTAIDVSPKRKTLAMNATMDLKVTARYSDGTARDVTALALFETNDRAMAEATGQGVVKTQDLPGNVAVMVRYSGHVAVCNIAIPLGGSVENFPAPKNFIDELVFANLKTLGIPPSADCGDEAFLRRATLDIAGRLPTVEEVNAFAQNRDPKKRDLAIDALLGSSDYADYFANKWTALLKNRREDAADITANFAFHAWMRDSLLVNMPYDQLARQVLGATGTIVSNPPVAWYKRVKEPAEQLEDVAQLFLGVRMQCAQCHHHPFERWSQDDYYALSAYFSQVGRKPTAVAGEDLIFHKRGIAQAENKRTRQKIRPAALGQTPPEILPDDDPRLLLADWMGEKNNPFFAKALINRYWKHFFKRGLVEPEDDLRDSNPATNPELLEALARHFIESGFDLREVVRVITRSQTYQLSEQPSEFNSVDHQNFSRFYPKRLPAEVLLDAIDCLTESKTDFPDLPAGTRAIALPDNSYNRSSAFLKVFGRPEGASVCECERSQSSSLAQSLHLMNSSEVKNKLTSATGRAARLAKPEVPLDEGIKDIYLTAFGREPTAGELEVAREFLARTRTDAEGKPMDPARAKRLAYEDLLWAIMNTKEFLFNH